MDSRDFDAGTVALPAPNDKPRLLGELIERYRAASEFQTAIGAATGASYQRAFD